MHPTYTVTIFSQVAIAAVHMPSPRGYNYLMVRQYHAFKLSSKPLSSYLPIIDISMEYPWADDELTLEPTLEKEGKAFPIYLPLPFN